MRHEDTRQQDQRIAAAIEELRATIASRYPTTTFEIFERDEPEGTRLRATVDIEDPDEVMDLIIDQLYEFQVERNLPVYVVPVQPLKRAVAGRRAQPPHVQASALPPLATGR